MLTVIGHRFERESDALSALEKLDNTEFLGRMLAVRMATAKQPHKYNNHRQSGPNHRSQPGDNKPKSRQMETQKKDAYEKLRASEAVSKDQPADQAHGSIPLQADGAPVPAVKTGHVQEVVDMDQLLLKPTTTEISKEKPVPISQEHTCQDLASDIAVSPTRRPANSGAENKSPKVGGTDNPVVHDDVPRPTSETVSKAVTENKPPKVGDI